MSAGVSAATFDGATRGLEPNDAASFLDNQPEFTTPIWDYMAGLVDEDRIRDGRARLRDYASPLASAEKLYGVDPATIVAVWGVESDYGRGIGKRPLVQSLATLSCEGRRQAFFRTELFATLKIIQNGDVAASALVGSWAGAFGLVGLIGALAATLGGRGADRIGPMRVLAISIGIVALSYVVLFAGPVSMAALVVGVILLDLGCQSALVSNQTSVMALDARAQGRLNTLYMTTTFLGGAAGAALSGWAMARFGWTGVATLGLSAALVAAVVHAVGEMRRV